MSEFDTTAPPSTHPAPEAIVEEQLDERITEVESALEADVLAYAGQLVYGADDLIRDAVEGIEGERRNRLGVILETSGGFIEVAQRIAETFRHHYSIVDFIIPNFAMSAGTVLVMSGNSIYMDYYSVLGPIDPQVSRPGSMDMVPALGYLVQYERLIAKSAEGTLTTAELAYLVDRFDPAELYRYEQARQLSISLLKEWLVKYKFRDWNETETRGKQVTKTMKAQRAASIAKMLNKTDRWHSHSRGISMEVLRRDLRLRVEDLGESKSLDSSVKSYYRLLKDYMMRRGHGMALHRNGRYYP